MVSPTKHTWTVRDRKAKRAGKKRKNQLATRGTTLPRADLFKVVEKA
ncbi:MAG: hypothetical protein V4534_04690 [Myxococcota bacterium]